MTIFNEFDRIRIVNLPKRRDRRRAMNRELSRLGLQDDPRVAYFPAIRPADQGDFTSIGARGVYASQKALLAEASQAGESILILEDDCTFRSGASEYSCSPGWDIFYGGYYASDPEHLARSDIIGAHMMGFSAQGARAVHAYLSTLEYTGIHPPIDAAYVWFRRANPDVVTHFAVPPLANQRSSRSDIASLRIYDRLPVVREVVNSLRFFKRLYSSRIDRQGS
ncbi:MAG: hypothetical protein KDE49_11155 [Novosphingobium sp.]|nr:hypothetical protein [Novosphingobium sp.]